MTKAWGEWLSQAVIILFCGLVLFEGADHSFGGNLLSGFCAIVTISLSLVIIFQTFKHRAKALAAKIDFDFSLYGLKAWIMAVVVVVYVLLIFELGYFTSTAIYLISTSYLTGLRDLKFVTITTVILIPLMYAFFEVFLQAGLPEGILI
jgi:hypothetical protein